MSTLSLFSVDRAPEPRPYQQRAIVALRAHALAGRRRILLVIPTAGGKTIVAANIIESARTNFQASILFVVHRIELIDQAVRALARVGVRDVGVLRGNDERTNPAAPVQVASIQTLARRVKPTADIVFVDEAHRSLADSYQKHVFAAYPNAVILGLTATPCRSDGRGLGQCFDALEQAATYSNLISDGFIAEPVIYDTPKQPDLSGVRTVAGDFDLAGLEAAMLAGELVGDVVATWLKLAERRRTVVFATGIDHSKQIVSRFQAAGVRAAHVDGSTPEDERALIAERLRSGVIELVSNVGIYTEGWDEPAVRCMVLARPTKSLSLFMQMAGRVLRMHPSAAPLILDHAGNVERHGLPHADREWTLEDGARGKPRATTKLCQACFAYIPIASKSCPLCGHEQPKPERREAPVEHGGVELVKRTGTPDEKRGFYDSQVERACARGFKPGFASAQFKEKYGVWPPWAWSQATKVVFAQDANWQERQRRREREREHWQEVERQRLERATAPVEEAVVDDDDGERPDDFLDWLGGQA